MRIWSLHPSQLDSRGLVAAWRESLLAQKVLAGLTLGYRNHPQLIRFRQQPDPLAAIGAYLRAVCSEATARGYRFDSAKIMRAGPAVSMPVTSGQVNHEWSLLKQKLRMRDPEKYAALLRIDCPKIHPSFRLVEGGIEPWERQKH